MAIIHFTQKDALQAKQAALPRIMEDHSGEVSLRIVTPEAHDCDGVQCERRLESALSEQEYARWLDCHERRPPMPRHSHLIVSGRTPDTRESIFPILTD